MKKLIAILLASSLFLYIIGYHFIFHLRKTELKAQMKKFLRSQPQVEDETVFVFSLDNRNAIAQLEWEGDDEFMLRGDMYDVIDKKITGGKLIIRCIGDKKETALLKKFEKLNDENNSRNRLALLLKLVTSSYIVSLNEELVIEDVFVPSIIYFQVQISSSVRKVLTPPPRVC